MRAKPSSRSGEGAAPPVQIDPVLLDRAKSMRRIMTEPERRLWHAIKAERLGAKFSRQVVIDHYIVDFVSRRAKLIIEVDGDTHNDPAREVVRDEHLASKGYCVIHLTNADVMTNLDGVLAAIGQAIAAPLSAATRPGGPSLAASPQRGEG